MEHLDEGHIHAWLDGALPDTEAAAVAAHVAACEACAAAVAEARGLIAASSRIVASLDDVPGGVIPERAPVFSQDNVTPIGRAASRSPQASSARPANTTWWRRSSVAAAAVLFIAAGSLLVTRERGPQSVLSMDSAASATASAPGAASQEAAAPRVITQAIEPSPQDTTARVMNDVASARRLTGEIEASTGQASRSRQKHAAAMSAPAASPVAAAPPAATSPVVAPAPPPPAAGGITFSTKLSGAPSGAGAGAATGNVASRGAGDLATSAARADERVAMRAESPARDTSANRVLAQASSATNATNAKATPPTPPGTRAIQDMNRQVSVPAAPRVQSDAAARLVNPAALAGCYTLDRAAQQTVSADARRFAPANALPARIRLSDTAVAGGPWLVARAIDAATVRIDVRLQWRLLSRDSLEIRRLTASDTADLRVGIDATGAMKRIECRP